eukprot:scaffold4296_cov136-Isochrysis_galbana.AAC.5
MTDPPIDDTQAREQDAPGTHDAKQRAPVHGHTGDLPPDKALSDIAAPKERMKMEKTADATPSTAGRTHSLPLLINPYSDAGPPVSHSFTSPLCCGVG